MRLLTFPQKEGDVLFQKNNAHVSNVHAPQYSHHDCNCKRCGIICSFWQAKEQVSNNALEGYNLSGVLQFLCAACILQVEVLSKHKRKTYPKKKRTIPADKEEDGYLES